MGANPFACFFCLGYNSQGIIRITKKQKHDHNNKGNAYSANTMKLQALPLSFQ